LRTNLSSLIHPLTTTSATLEQHYEKLADKDGGLDDRYNMHNRQPSVETGSNDPGNLEWLVGDREVSAGDIGRDPVSNSSQIGTPTSRLPGLRSQRSTQSVQSRDTTLSIGIPSIERPRNSSMTSLASSKISAIERNLKKPSSRDTLAEQNNGLPPTAGKSGLAVSSGASKFLRQSTSKQSLVEGKEDKIRSSIPSPTPFGLLQIQTSHSPRHLPSGPDSATGVGNPILSGHLIPSRRSSLRHSTCESPQSRGSKRLSSSSYDLKSLNIDQDLIEEDDSTVRRIRELQDAKDQRQNEWRRETRRSEKLKRNSMPSPKVIQKSISHRSSHSVVGILVEVPDKENGQTEQISATPDAKSVKEKSSSLTRVTNEAEIVPRRISSAIQTKDSVKADERKPDLQNVSPPTHRRRLSSTLKKSLTTNSISLDSSDTLQALIDDEVDAFLKSPRFTQKIKHPRTGRMIAFSEVGDPDGFPVLCCVGMGLTRYLTAFYDELARTLKLRLITPDRPGIGGSDPCPDGQGTPLNWADDVYVLCKHLGITRFSLLAHSAGAIYALATALRLPQYVRGRIRLLAPWIPPSQLSSMSSSKEPAPMTEVPFAQKLLAVLPASFLKVANARFMSATSASISPKVRSKRRRGIVGLEEALVRSSTPEQTPEPLQKVSDASQKLVPVSCYEAQTTTLVKSGVIPSPPATLSAASVRSSMGSRSQHHASPSTTISLAARLALYDSTLTHRIWDLATANANPAVDLLVCLERRALVGFRYADVTRAVVIHHGSQDSRVSVEKARWLGKVMKRCEVRVIEGGDHGLMANAGVMAEVLGEVAREWEEWKRVVEGRSEGN
jgi:pimeloyl-ACP methyl ester carboxylesterase